VPRDERADSSTEGGGGRAAARRDGANAPSPQRRGLDASATGASWCRGPRSGTLAGVQRQQKAGFSTRCAAAYLVSAPSELLGAGTRRAPWV